MRVLLVAINFMRENRWPVLLLLLWIVLSAVVFGGSGQRVAIDDLVFYVRQQALYIVVFTAFLASTAVNNERKSRRILLVLSKAISRGEYLLSLLTGALLVAAVYAATLGLCCSWLAVRSGASDRGVWLMVIVVLAASALSAAMSLFWSTFLNPFLATAITAAVFSAPALADSRNARSLWTPGLPLLMNVLHFGFAPSWRVNWMAIGIAVVEAFVFWALATLVFARKDIAVPIE
jgi:ABC-type transport system involved in multi-copper enzyme maturation permease subunit